MVKTENVTINGKVFVRAYSDSGYMIERDGVQYEEAIDPIGIGRTYTETDVKADSSAEDAEYAEAGKILLGVTE